MEEKVTGLSIDLIIHPGETIKEVLEDRKMKQEELAIRTKFSAKHISEVIAGKKDISNSFAVALEYALGIPASFWINLQGIYDKEILELEKEENICSEEKSIIKKLKDITDFCIKNKIIPAINDKKILILNMRKFLQVNDLVDIKKLVIRQSAFRTTKEQH